MKKKISFGARKKMIRIMCSPAADLELQRKRNFDRGGAK